MSKSSAVWIAFSVFQSYKLEGTVVAALALRQRFVLVANFTFVFILCDSKMQRMVNIRNLKEFATKQLPKDSALREVLLKEPEEIEVNEFLARLPLYLQLASMKTAPLT